MTSRIPSQQHGYRGLAWKRCRATQARIRITGMQGKGEVWRQGCRT